MKRYLITTADERSWEFDRPVLFLGEWCLRYDRRHVWSEMDAIVVEPYGLEPGQKSRDIDHVQALAGELLNELTEALNGLHQTEHSQRYWNIVLGHWLQRYVAVAFNRYHTLEQALNTHEVAGTTVFESDDYSLATTDSLNFIWACNDDQWNHVLYSRLMAYRGDVELNPVSTPLDAFKGFSPENDRPNGHRERTLRRVRQVVSLITQKLARNTDAFIINSYLPIEQEIKLQLALGQVPQLWRSPSFERTLPDLGMRAQLALNHAQDTGVEGYTRWQLPELIPTCYLEGYGRLLEATRALPWPERPKFIFTSNSFDTDEIFKSWTAAEVEHGVPYFTGQHGNNYGTLVGNANWPERVTADRFLTWGWIDDSNNSTPAFVFKTAGDNAGEFDPNGGVLLIEALLSHWLGPADDYYECGRYQDEQFRFAETLPAHIHRELTVRLHGASKYLPWCDEQRWKDRSPGTQLDAGATSIRQLMAQSRIIVHSYDSTGMLETLSLNIPTVCFWRGGLDHLLPSAKPCYELLRSAGIILRTPEQAAERIALYWDNVSKWWHSQIVQDARKTFCERYARTEKYPVRTLKRLLTTNADAGQEILKSNYVGSAVAPTRSASPTRAKE